MKNMAYSKYAFMAFFIVAIVLSFMIIKPFAVAIISGMVIAYLFFPLHKKLNEYVTKKHLAAFISTILILLVVSLPLMILLGVITKDAKGFYDTTKERISQFKSASAEKCNNAANDATTIICSARNRIKGFIAENPWAAKNIQSAIAGFSRIFIDYTSSLLLSIPKMLLDLFIMLFVAYYCFKDGESIVAKFYDLLPFSASFKADIKKQTNDIVYSTVYGIILIGIIQGFVATIGFIVFGIEHPVFWGFITIIVAILPFVGSTIIWIPAALSLILKSTAAVGNAANNIFVWKGIGLFIYGFLIISGIDTILKPKIISARSRVHPVVILLGLFGGIMLLGPIGLIVGPLMLAILLSFIKVYEKDKKLLLKH